MAAFSQISPDLYVLIQFDGVYLLIPQSEVEAIEILSDVNFAHLPNGAVGWFGYGQDVPVFCLSSDMELLTDVPKARQYFVLLNSADQRVGVVCDDALNLNIVRSNLIFQPLPSVMTMPYSPISHLVVYQEKVGCVCSGEAFIQYLAHLAELFATEQELD